MTGVVNDRKMPADSSGLAKVAVQCSADSFIVNQTLVTGINSNRYQDGKNGQLRQPEKRFLQ